MRNSTDPTEDPGNPQTQVRLRLERAQRLLDDHGEIDATGEFISTLPDAFPKGTEARARVQALCDATVPEVTVDNATLKKMIAEALGAVVAYQGIAE